MRLPLLLSGTLLVAACAPAPIVAPARSAVPDLVGRAAFPCRALQATTADVAANATVLLLDAKTQATVASTVAGATGGFTLSFGAGFTPAAGTPYVLEAVRGLGADRMGRAAVRIRTLVQIADGGWLSLTNGAVGGTMELSVATTAVAIAAAQIGPTDLPPATLIGSYDAGTSVYTPVAGLSDKVFSQVAELVAQALDEDGDPVQDVTRDAGGRWVWRGQPYQLTPAGVGGRLFYDEDVKLRLEGGPGQGSLAVDMGDGSGFQPVPYDPGAATFTVRPTRETGRIQARALGGVSDKGALRYVADKVLTFSDDALRDPAADTATWTAAGVWMAVDAFADAPRPFVASLMQTGAIDCGSDAEPWVRYGRSVLVSASDVSTPLAFEFQTSADGTTWGAGWVPAADLPSEHGRYLRFRTPLLTTDPLVSPLVTGLRFQAQASAAP